jgi:hypothetical protein
MTSLNKQLINKELAKRGAARIFCRQEGAGIYLQIYAGKTARKKKKLHLGGEKNYPLKVNSNAKYNITNITFKLFQERSYFSRHHKRIPFS